MNTTKQHPIRLPRDDKRAVRTQFGALCYRIQNGKLRILIVTTRSGNNWIIPKGWPIDGATPAQAAAREAFEEAGVEGKVATNSLGIYSYTKELEEDNLPCVVVLFALKVKKIHAIYPEKAQRKRKWLSRKKAAALVSNPELSHLITSFTPD